MLQPTRLRHAALATMLAASIVALLPTIQKRRAAAAEKPSDRTAARGPVSVEGLAMAPGTARTSAGIGTAAAVNAAAAAAVNAAASATFDNAATPVPSPCALPECRGGTPGMPPSARPAETAPRWFGADGHPVLVYPPLPPP